MHIYNKKATKILADAKTHLFTHIYFTHLLLSGLEFRNLNACLLANVAHSTHPSLRILQFECKKKRNACLKSQRLQRREAVKMGKPTIDKYQANGYCCLSLSITVTPHKLS